MTGRIEITQGGESIRVVRLLAVGVERVEDERGPLEVFVRVLTPGEGLDILVCNASGRRRIDHRHVDPDDKVELSLIGRDKISYTFVGD